MSISVPQSFALSSPLSSPIDNEELGFDPITLAYFDQIGSTPHGGAIRLDAFLKESNLVKNRDHDRNPDCHLQPLKNAERSSGRSNRFENSGDQNLMEPRDLSTSE